MSFDDELKKITRKWQSEAKSQQDEEYRKNLEAEKGYAIAAQHVNASLAVAQSFIIPLLRKTNKVAQLNGRLEVYNGNSTTILDGKMDSLGFSRLDRIKPTERHSPIVECKLIWEGGFDGQHELIITLHESKFQNIPISDTRFKSAIEKYILEQLSDPSKTYRQIDRQSP